MGPEPAHGHRLGFVRQCLGRCLRIDLYQDGPDGPQLRANIAPATEDDGQFTWIAASSGLDYGTYGLRVQTLQRRSPGRRFRSTETFTVPENTTTFYVNDASTTWRRVRHGSGQQPAHGQAAAISEALSEQCAADLPGRCRADAVR